MFKNPFSFNGRIRRTEYGISYLIYMGVYLAIAYGMASTDMNPVLLVVYIPLIWFLLAQGAKRCHDRGNSGWYQLIPLYVFWLVFADGEVGHNEYGPNPKGIGNEIDPNDLGQHIVE